MFLLGQELSIFELSESCWQRKYLCVFKKYKIAKSMTGGNPPKKEVPRRHLVDAAACGRGPNISKIGVVRLGISGIV